MPSDSRNYFGFVVVEFTELVHTTKSFVIRLPVTVSNRLNARKSEIFTDFPQEKTHANVLRVIDVC